VPDFPDVSVYGGGGSELESEGYETGYDSYESEDDRSPVSLYSEQTQKEQHGLHDSSGKASFAAHKQIEMHDGHLNWVKVECEKLSKRKSFVAFENYLQALAVRHRSRKITLSVTLQQYHDVMPYWKKRNMAEKLTESHFSARSEPEIHFIASPRNLHKAEKLAESHFSARNEPGVHFIGSPRSSMGSQVSQ